MSEGSSRRGTYVQVNGRKKKLCAGGGGGGNVSWREMKFPFHLR